MELFIYQTENWRDIKVYFNYLVRIFSHAPFIKIPELSSCVLKIEWVFSILIGGFV